MIVAIEAKGFKGKYFKVLEKVDATKDLNLGDIPLEK